jgi:hypothetical protein
MTNMVAPDVLAIHGVKKPKNVFVGGKIHATQVIIWII